MGGAQKDRKRLHLLVQDIPLVQALGIRCLVVTCPTETPQLAVELPELALDCTSNRPLAVERPCLHKDSIAAAQLPFGSQMLVQKPQNSECMVVASAVADDRAATGECH